MQDDNLTLDSCHTNQMNEFTKNDTIVIPQLIKERETLQQNLKTNSYSFAEKIRITDKIKEIRNDIKNMKKQKQDYLLNNSKYVFGYFEEKKALSVGQNDVTVIDKFFNIKEQPTKNDKTTNLSKQYFQKLLNTRFNINDYIEDKDICKICNNGELIPVANEGLLICNNCSAQTSHVIDSDKPSYKEPPKEVCFYAYKRINHFREILAQFQAKETTQIPDEVIQRIAAQIKKERITIDKLTNSYTKDILKRLGLNKYYEHIPFIKDKLGIKPPVMTPELETTLCNLFLDIQKPYAKFCPDGRVNFLNYYYTIYKLCELLGETKFLPYFPMLKDREKRIEQDEIWKNICKELNWEFIVTL